MRDLVPILMNSIIMFALIFIANLYINNDWIKLIAGITIGFTYYLLSELLFKSIELKEITSIIRNK